MYLLGQVATAADVAQLGERIQSVIYWGGFALIAVVAYVVITKGWSGLAAVYTRLVEDIRGTEPAAPRPQPQPQPDEAQPQQARRLNRAAGIPGIKAKILAGVLETGDDVTDAVLHMRGADGLLYRVTHRIEPVTEKEGPAYV